MSWFWIFLILIVFVPIALNYFGEDEVPEPVIYTDSTDTVDTTVTYEDTSPWDVIEQGQVDIEKESQDFENEFDDFERQMIEDCLEMGLRC